MWKRPYFVNPFGLYSPKVDSEIKRLRELRITRVSESSTWQEGLLIMITKLIEMTEQLSRVVSTGDKAEMAAFAALAKEIHEEEKLLTKYLIASSVSGDMMKGIIRFPYRMERMGDLLENILHCLRMKFRDNIQFSAGADEELAALLTELILIMTSLREAFTLPTEDLLIRTTAEGQKLGVMVEESISNHWKRLEQGVCSPAAGAAYREILDSIKWNGEYLMKMTDTLLELGVKTAALKAG